MAEAKKQQASPFSQRMAWAYAHPVRARALMSLAGRIASPREIADELDEPLGKVSYHVRALRDAGLIELVETDARRGGVQHFYQATRLAIIDTKTAKDQGSGERAVSSAVVISLMISDVAAAVEAGAFDTRPERVLVRHHAYVDKQGWDELSELHTSAMYRSIAIHKESVERLRESGEAGIPTGIHSLVFELAEQATPAIPEVVDATLELVDGRASSLSARGGSKRRRADDGDAP